MNTKIIIEVRGGLVQAVYANQDIEYILVDHDNLDIEPEEFDLSAHEPDRVESPLSELYLDDAVERGTYGYERSQRIGNILKEINW